MKRLSVLGSTFIVKRATLFAIMGIAFVSAQTPKINSSIPVIAPPSPTVSSLMKFEEIPVDNYTGVPNISVPIASIPTRSSEVSINVSLNYHPGSIAAEEVASNTGLGWNLLAGGTISRTVRGLPDEYFDPLNPVRFGIYRQENPYYENEAKYNQIGSFNTYSDQDVKDFFWTAAEKGKYDTEHDLYQYNFMGFSGRFYMRKSTSGFEVVKLNNDNALKIQFNNGVFTITDDKGFKYMFEEIESTTMNTITAVEYFQSSTIGIGADQQPPITYDSAYHLSRIEDNTTLEAAKRLATFTYNTDQENTHDVSETINWLDAPTFSYLFVTFQNSCTGPLWDRIEPERIISTQFRNTNTKKIRRIEIPNKAKIDFILDDQGRADTVSSSSSSGESLVGGKRLKMIQVKDWNENMVKNYTLYHSYSEVRKHYKRMRLDSIVENNTQSYTFQYKDSDYSNTEARLGIDYWGYFNLKPYNKQQGIYRETTSETCIYDVLTTMTLPTGGIINYEFESNDYSYDGDIRLEDFSENPDRFLFTTDAKTVGEPNLLGDGIDWSDPDRQSLGNPFLDIQDRQNVRITANSNAPYSWYVSLLKANAAGGYDNTGFSVNNNACDQGQCYFEGILEEGKYYAIWKNFDTNGGGFCYVMMNYLKRNPNTYHKKYLIGGGIRIKSISYLDKGNILGQKNYNYNFDSEKNRSSGSLAFPKPLYTYETAARHTIKPEDNVCMTNDANFYTNPIFYRTTTSFNALSPINTKGGYVGYKNVAVSQVGYIPSGQNIEEVSNGKIVYTYTSPIDEPPLNVEKDTTGVNVKYVFMFPFKQTINKDYKKGILKSEKYFNEYDKLLSESTYEHAIDADEKWSGLRIFTGGVCPWGKTFYNYDSYRSKIESCTDPIPCYHCGDPYDYVLYDQIFDHFGWVKLINKTTKNYFYDKSNNSKIVEIKEFYDYNGINKKISNYEKETYTKANTTPEKVSEQYEYLINPTISAQNDISKMLSTRTYVNGEQVSKQQIVYSNAIAPGSPDYLPNVVQAGKGNNTPENRLRFNQYDIMGSPVEVMQENGMPIVYLYDRDSHNPIAMIENATYAQVVGLLGTPSSLLGYSESNMSAINGLRAQLPQANITTYTYKPLVGVETVTDPRGKKTTYSYDNFGRLIKVQDDQGNIISENVYKYRNQN